MPAAVALGAVVGAAGAYVQFLTVGASILGGSTLTSFLFKHALISGALSGLQHLLTPKPNLSTSTPDTDATVVSSAVAREYLFGRVKTGGSLIYFGEEAPEEGVDLGTVYYALALSEGEISYIERLWVNGYEFRVAGSNNGKYILTITDIDGSNLQLYQDRPELVTIAERMITEVNGFKPLEVIPAFNATGNDGLAHTTLRQKFDGWTDAHSLKGISWVLVRLRQPSYDAANAGDEERGALYRTPNPRMQFVVLGKSITWPGFTPNLSSQTESNGAQGAAGATGAGAAGGQQGAQGSQVTPKSGINSISTPINNILVHKFGLNAPVAMARKGSNVYAADSADKKIYGFSISGGTLVREASLDISIPSITKVAGLEIVGNNMYILARDAKTVYVRNMTTGAITNQFYVGGTFSLDLTYSTELNKLLVADRDGTKLRAFTLAGTRAATTFDQNVDVHVKFLTISGAWLICSTYPDENIVFYHKPLIGTAIKRDAESRRRDITTNASSARGIVVIAPNKIALARAEGGGPSGGNDIIAIYNADTSNPQTAAPIAAPSLAIERHINGLVLNVIVSNRAVGIRYRYKRDTALYSPWISTTKRSLSFRNLDAGITYTIQAKEYNLHGDGPTASITGIPKGINQDDAVRIRGAANDSNYIYLLDAADDRIIVFNAADQTPAYNRNITSLTTYGVTRPTAIAVVGANVYIADSNSPAVDKIVVIDVNTRLKVREFRIRQNQGVASLIGTDDSIFISYYYSKQLVESTLYGVETGTVYSTQLLLANLDKFGNYWFGVDNISDTIIIYNKPIGSLGITRDTETRKKDIKLIGDKYRGIVAQASTQTGYTEVLVYRNTSLVPDKYLVRDEANQTDDLINLHEAGVTTPSGIAIDGQYFVVSNKDGTRLTFFGLSDFAYDEDKDITLPFIPWGIAVHTAGTRYFVGSRAYSERSYIAQYNSNGTEVANTRYALPSTAIKPRGMFYDGTYLWVVEQATKSVLVYNATTRALVTTLALDRSLHITPTGIWIYGNTMFITDIGLRRCVAYDIRYAIQAPTEVNLTTDNQRAIDNGLEHSYIVSACREEVEKIRYYTTGEAGSGGNRQNIRLDWVNLCAWIQSQDVVAAGLQLLRDTVSDVGINGIKPRGITGIIDPVLTRGTLYIVGVGPGDSPEDRINTFLFSTDEGGDDNEPLTVKQGWTRNAAAIRYWYLTERLGFTDNDLDITSVAAAVRVCDELVNVPVDKTDPKYKGWLTSDIRYAIDGIVRSGDTPEDVSSELDFCWQGNVIEKNGILHFRPGVDRPASYNVYIPDYVVGTPIITPAPALSDRVNAISMAIPQSMFHKYTPYNLPVIKNEELLVRDGIYKEVSLGQRPFIANPLTCIRYATIALRRVSVSTAIQYILGPGDDFRFLSLVPSDILFITDPENGLNEARMEVISMRILPNFSVSITVKHKPIGIYSPTLALPTPDEYNPIDFADPVVPPTAPASISTVIGATTFVGGKWQTKVTVSAPKPSGALKIQYRVYSADRLTYNELQEDNGIFQVDVFDETITCEARGVSGNGLVGSAVLTTVFLPSTPTKPSLPRVNRTSIGADVLTVKVGQDLQNPDVKGFDIRGSFAELDNLSPNLPALTEDNWESDIAVDLIESSTIATASEHTVLTSVPKAGKYNLFMRAANSLGVKSAVAALGQFSLVPASSSVLNHAQHPNWVGAKVGVDVWDVEESDGFGLLLPDRDDIANISFDRWNGSEGWLFGESSSATRTYTTPTYSFDTARTVNAGHFLSEVAIPGVSAAGTYSIQFQHSDTLIGAWTSRDITAAGVEIANVRKYRWIITLSADFENRAIKSFNGIV